MSGVFVAVAGPSGAGKDTLIERARAHFTASRKPVVFVRRIVTRMADAAAEDHDTLTPEAFEKARACGRFACSWSANGLSYALPGEVDAIVGSGRVAVANVSRGVLGALRERYPRVLAIIVTASDAVLAERLAARGRESRAEIRERLSRNGIYEGFRGQDDAIVIDNSGPPDDAAARFIAAIEKALA